MFWLENDAVKPYVKAVITCVRQEKFLPSFFKLSHFLPKHRSLPLHAELAMWVRWEEVCGRWPLFPYDLWSSRKAKKSTFTFSSFFGFFRSWLPQQVSILRKALEQGDKRLKFLKRCKQCNMHSSQASAWKDDMGCEKMNNLMVRFNKGDCFRFDCKPLCSGYWQQRNTFFPPCCSLLYAQIFGDLPVICQFESDLSWGQSLCEFQFAKFSEKINGKKNISCIK